VVAGKPRGFIDEMPAVSCQSVQPAVGGKHQRVVKTFDNVPCVYSIQLWNRHQPVAIQSRRPACSSRPDRSAVVFKNIANVIAWQTVCFTEDFGAVPIVTNQSASGTKPEYAGAILLYAANVVNRELVRVSDPDSIKNVDAARSRKPQSIAVFLQTERANVITAQSSVGIECDKAIHVISNSSVLRAQPQIAFAILVNRLNRSNVRKLQRLVLHRIIQRDADISRKPQLALTIVQNGADRAIFQHFAFFKRN